MAIYPQPSENQPIFNDSNFGPNDALQATINEFKKYFITYPISQALVTLQETNVTQDLSVGGNITDNGNFTFQQTTVPADYGRLVFSDGSVQTTAGSGGGGGNNGYLFLGYTLYPVYSQLDGAQGIYLNSNVNQIYQVITPATTQFNYSIIMNQQLAISAGGCSPNPNSAGIGFNLGGNATAGGTAYSTELVTSGGTLAGTYQNICNPPLLQSTIIGYPVPCTITYTTGNSITLEIQSSYRDLMVLDINTLPLGSCVTSSAGITDTGCFLVEFITSIINSYTFTISCIATQPWTIGSSTTFTFYNNLCNKGLKVLTNNNDNGSDPTQWTSVFTDNDSINTYELCVGDYLYVTYDTIAGTVNTWFQVINIVGSLYVLNNVLCSNTTSYIGASSVSGSSIDAYVFSSSQTSQGTNYLRCTNGASTLFTLGNGPTGGASAVSPATQGANGGTASIISTTANLTTTSEYGTQGLPSPSDYSTVYTTISNTIATNSYISARTTTSYFNLANSGGWSCQNSSTDGPIVILTLNGYGGVVYEWYALN